LRRGSKEAELGGDSLQLSAVVVIIGGAGPKEAELEKQRRPRDDPAGNLDIVK
jgi:hypothetical protein